MALRDSTLHKIQMALYLAFHAHTTTLISEIRKEVYSEEICFGFRRDLEEPFTTPTASIPVQLRLLQKADIDKLFDFQKLKNGNGNRAKAIMDRLRRLAFIDANIPECYVGTGPDGSPCFIQWLIEPWANDKVQTYFKGYFPPLNPNEVMLEGVFVPERYRGKKIMPFAMSKIAEMGRAAGAKWAVTYVQDFNLASIKGVLQAGFRPYLIRKARWRCFQRKLEFKWLAQEERSELEDRWQHTFGLI